MPACPHCGFQTGADGAECPLCGSRLVTSPPTMAYGARTTPWEDPEGAFPTNLIRTWRQSVFEPTAFFRRMPVDAPLARPLLYYLIISVVTAFFILIWRSASRSVFPIGLLAEEPLAPLIEFFLEPFLAIMGLAVGSLVLHLLVLLLAERRKGLGATARVFCYSWGPGVFSLFPMLGPPVGFIWSVVLMVVGVREAHETTAGRAAAIVLTPLIALFILLLFLAALLVMFGLTGEVLDW